jgi:hypothetical protein
MAHGTACLDGTWFFMHFQLTLPHILLLLLL